MKAKVNNLIIIKTTCRWLIAFSLISAQMFLPTAYAASSKKINFNQLITKSDVIVVGKCTVIESEWRKNKIYSYATIQIDNVIKGAAPSVIKVEYLGGTALHPNLKVPVSMNVSTGIEFAVGNENVLLLTPLTNGRFQLVGVTQGKIPVVIDSASGEKVIQSGMKKIQSKPSAKDGSIILTKRQMSLQEFEKFIQSRMKIEKQRNKR